MCLYVYVSLYISRDCGRNHSFFSEKENYFAKQKRFNNTYDFTFSSKSLGLSTKVFSVEIKKVYSKEEVVCVFQPHRISRLKNLKKEYPDISDKDIDIKLEEYTDIENNIFSSISLLG